MIESTEEDVDNYKQNSSSEADEEVELILEGSELYKYLRSFQNEEVEVYSNKIDHSNEISAFSQSTCIKGQALKEVLEFTNKILHSNLLLEEDAAHLFKVSSDLIAERTTFMHSKKWACGVFVFELISAYFFIKFNTHKVPLLAFMTGSSVLLASMVNNFLKNSAYEKKLTYLLNVLQQIFVLIKKSIKAVTEDDSLLASKEKLQWLSRPENHVKEELSFKRKMAEISTMSLKITTALKCLITTSRNATFSLMKLYRENSYRNEDYIAFYCDEKLGINETLNSSKRPYNLAALHNLKNIYLLMQSECLRLLGLCFCQCKSYCDVDNIFKVVYTYNKELSCILYRLQDEYKKYFYPSFKQTDKCPSITKVFEGHFLIHDISRTLNGLLVEVRELEEHIEMNENSREIDERVLSSINKVETEFLAVLETCKQVKEHYLRHSINNKAALKTQELNDDTQNESITMTNETVGFSDFSIRVADEVFLGSSDGVQNSNEYVEDFSEFKPPNTLIKELKVALVKKREEFEERELKALKSPDDIEAYKSCSYDSSLLPIQKPLNSGDKITKYKNEVSQHFRDHKENLAPTHEDHCSLFRNSDSMASGSFQKDIATAASIRSSQWNQMQTIDYFEDEFSD